MGQMRRKGLGAWGGIWGKRGREHGQREQRRGGYCAV